MSKYSLFPALEALEHLCGSLQQALVFDIFWKMYSHVPQLLSGSYLNYYTKM